MNSEVEAKIIQFFQDILDSEYPNGVSMKIKYNPEYGIEIIEEIKRHRIRTPKIRVKYDDNHFSCKGRYEFGVRVLSDVIRYVGPEEVMKLGLMTSGGLNLVQTDPDIINSKGPYYVGKGYWIITKIPNSEKENLIRQINNILEKNWRIQHDNQGD